MLLFWQGVACIVAGLAGFGCPLPDSKAVRYYTGMAGKGQEFHQFAEVTTVRFDYNGRDPVDLPPVVGRQPITYARRHLCQFAASYTACAG